MKKLTQRDIMISKIDLESTEYFGVGLSGVSVDEIRLLFEKYPKWKALTLKEKQYFNKKSIASVSLEEFIKSDYGGEDPEVIKLVTKEYNEAVEYIKNEKI